MIPKIKVTVTLETKIKKSEMLIVKSSNDLFKHCLALFDVDTFHWTEQMILLCLNAKGGIIGYFPLSHGGICSTLCDPKTVFTTALNCPPTVSIILIHNHPSGSLNPSKSDIQCAQKLKAAAKFLDLNLLDSCIITDEGVFSLADEGLL